MQQRYDMSEPCAYLVPESDCLCIGRILILGSRVTSQCCSAHAHIWRCCLLSSPCFLTSPYMERAPGHVTAAQSRDLASPIYGHVGALTLYNWPRDLSRDLISLGPDTGVCNGCNVCPIYTRLAM